MKSFIKKFIPSFILSFYHLFLALAANVFYGFPSRRLKVIGVTGTNGKSTVVYFLAAIFEEAGFKTGSISSIFFKIGRQEWRNELKMTMPGRFKIQKFLNQCVKEKCDYVFLEVTSEGIKQFRHKGIRFKGAIFTNLSKEHIESHGSFEKYKRAKEKLFASLKGRLGTFTIINQDDESASVFAKYAAEKKLFYSLKESFYQTIGFGSKFQIEGKMIALNLPGEFNASNALAAITAAKAEGISIETAAKALANVKFIPGRLEKISDKPPIIVDYAHTPDALEKVYGILSEVYADKPLVCVFGSAGGGRDKWKRPEMGKIASRYCSAIILTNEDSYDENSLVIIEDIANGFISKFKIQNSKFKIIDRKEAIVKGIEITKKTNGVLIITGKGAEPWMMGPKGKKIPWDDREIVKSQLLQ